MNMFKDDFIEWCVAVYNKLLGMPMRYNYSFEEWSIPKTINSNCADISFVNQGTTVLVINGSLVLAPGSSAGFTSQKNEKDTTLYRITFTGAGDNSCCIVKKHYNHE